MKKCFNLLTFGVVSLLALTFTAQAASTSYISCESDKIKPGESTVCTVYGTSDLEVATAQGTIETSKYLSISKVTPNATDGWTDVNAGTTPGETYKFSFSKTATAAVAKPFEIFSFTLTLSEEAKNLTEGDCGNLCISSVYFNTNTSASLPSNGSCYNPVVVIDKCTGDNCAETGAFANYAILGSCALVALIAVIAVNKNKKFYRV